MSGQFPAPEAGSAPVTMNTFSGWNQPGNQQQGHGAASGAQQSAVHGVVPQPQPQAQPLMQPNQVSGSPPKPLKITSVAQNGSSGCIPASVISQNSPTTLTDNLRQNFHLNFNTNVVSGQSIKLSSVGALTTPTTTSSGSIDLSKSPRSVESNQIKPLGTHQLSQNHSVISSVGTSLPFNGEVHSRTSTVSVIANASTSPIKKVADVSGLSVVKADPESRSKEDVKVSEEPKGVVIGSAGLVLKVEAEVVKENETSSQSSTVLEPPFKKPKEEDTRFVNNSVSIDSSSSKPGVTHTKPEEPIICQGTKTVTNDPPATASSLSGKQDALDVESQLEALFAGIADEGDSSKELKPPETPHNQQGTPNVAAVLESKSSSIKKVKGKANGVPKSNDVCGLTSTESTPKKRRKKKPAKDKPWEDSKSKKLKKGGPSKGKYVKEASCDSGSNTSSSRVKGPVVHIEGTKDAPSSIVIVNAPSRQDDEDNDSKKRMTSSRVRKSHTIEGKLSSTGLCGNSLVSRYEAHTSDPRWVCVFCKRGCHIEGLGDLFGPYLVNHDPELERSLDLDAEKGGDKKDKKNKRSGLGQTGVLGLLAIPPLPGEQPQFMVYFHEHCAVWSPSINLIGSRLAGVQEAVWVAVRSKCSRCLSDGANVGCIQHGCSLQVHYPCARDSHWSLDDTTFISCCLQHKKQDQSGSIAAIF